MVRSLAQAVANMMLSQAPIPPHNLVAPQAHTAQTQEAQEAQTLSAQTQEAEESHGLLDVPLPPLSAILYR